ncbi:MAG: flagellar biosynthetic protein FliO [Deltaproteobacteria bacterium]|nr:MAG: flagellar biosynthetic protein FliO [Deltaproteobacteria bacterium]
MKRQTVDNSYCSFRGRLWTLVIVFVVWCASPLGAEESGQGLPSPTSDMTMATIKMLASLLLIIGLIIVVFYILKRFRGLPKLKQEGPSMRIAGSLAIAPKRSVTVVEVDDKWLVLGVGTESINLLYMTDSKSEVVHERAGQEGPAGAFQKILNKKKMLFGESLRGDHEA